MANVFEPDWDIDRGDPWRSRIARVAAQAGAARLGASVFEIDPGGVGSPLHTHLVNEELVVALSAGVTLRTPEGERVLEPGEVVSCPVGRDGAHQLRNRGDQTARVLVVSEMRLPEVAEQLDSGKLVVFEGVDEEGLVLSAFRREDGVEPMADEPGG